MKQLFLSLLAVGVSFLCRAQNGGTAAEQNKLNVTVSNERLSLQYQNKSIELGSLEALDSCLKHIIPVLGRPTILVGSEDGTDRERMRQVAVILESYHCPVLAGAKRNSAPPPPLTRRVDISGH